MLYGCRLKRETWVQLGQTRARTRSVDASTGNKGTTKLADRLNTLTSEGSGQKRRLKVVTLSFQPGPLG
jgi:hypothetical protein